MAYGILIAVLILARRECYHVNAFATVVVTPPSKEIAPPRFFFKTTTCLTASSQAVDSSAEVDGSSVATDENDDDSGVSSTNTMMTSYKAPQIEINRRRNLAIISHPDSGKTTMTEKLLLYGGAVQQAGAVRQKAQQRSTQSDFMKLEQERGISISSTVMNFEYGTYLSDKTTTTTSSDDADDNDNNDNVLSMKYGIRLLDTPGHQDFSEDTYRALAAADNALMLLDAAKGLEPQTRKLFEVVRLRKLPLFTFCNKMDRPALSPYEIMDQIYKEFGLETIPIVWPIGDGDRFKGVLDRLDNTVHLYTKAQERGKKANEIDCISIDDTQRLKELINDDELYEKLLEDVELLSELIPPLDMNKVYRGEQSPLFFGSAMTNFGVQLFLDKFCEMGIKPLGRLLHVDNNNDNDSVSETEHKDSGNSHDESSSSSLLVTPEHEEFTGFIFKTQANLDPKHRDRLAYVRIVSGVYEKGMKVSHSRSKINKKYNLAQAQALFGSDRTSIQVAYPGDVIGINNPNSQFAIGDTLYTGTRRVAFPGIPSFSPEKFAYIRSPNPSSQKSFRKGINQLLDEGAVQALRQRNDDGTGSGPLLLAAVGQLQFEVVQARLEDEYNVECIMEPLAGFTLARWVDGGWDAVDKANADNKLFGIMIVQDKWQRPVLLFRNEWKAQSLLDEVQYLQLKPWSQPPRIDN